MDSSSIVRLLEKAIASREPLFDSGHEQAFRLFNGFTEGCPDIVIDVYGCTFLIHDYSDGVEQNTARIEEIKKLVLGVLPWLRAGILKTRNDKTPGKKRGELIFGTKPDSKIKEHGVWYSIDLTMNRDASLYLDTRNLRKWLLENSKNRSVLNTFAYTGSFGVAATAAGASRVVQLDRTRQFLNVGRDSYTLNGFPIHKADFIAADFFTQVSKFKRTGELFDCILIDPPFFSVTDRGKVDQENESARLINKVRPLASDGGHLIAINNALYVSGREYMRTLESLCQDGYLKVKELIPVPDDFTGYPGTRTGNAITDPAPFNHSTKIAVLEVRRKGFTDSAV
jgi:23S rRNA (cytosine1962-C5)-methyltransferase